MQYSISADNILVDKLLNLSGRDGCECFSFNPFGEIVDNHYSVLNTTSAFGKLTDQVNPHTANGHKLVMDVSSSGWAFDTGENRWHLSHFQATPCSPPSCLASSNPISGF